MHMLILSDTTPEIRTELIGARVSSSIGFLAENNIIAHSFMPPIIYMNTYFLSNFVKKYFRISSVRLFNFRTHRSKKTIYSTSEHIHHTPDILWGVLICPISEPLSFRPPRSAAIYRNILTIPTNAISLCSGFLNRHKYSSRWGWTLGFVSSTFSALII